MNDDEREALYVAATGLARLMLAETVLREAMPTGDDVAREAVRSALAAVERAITRLQRRVDVLMHERP